MGFFKSGMFTFLSIDQIDLRILVNNGEVVHTLASWTISMPRQTSADLASRPPSTGDPPY